MIPGCYEKATLHSHRMVCDVEFVAYSQAILVDDAPRPDAAEIAEAAGQSITRRTLRRSCSQFDLG